MDWGASRSPVLTASPSLPLSRPHQDPWWVWDHITALLADPALIRAEITKRLERARTADPATRQRQHLELGLAKAGTGITAMIQAYSEQLITIDELRARMPDLRARETSELSALDAQLADRDAYLKLADDLEGFLARLRGNAATASTEERQRVLRLLIKDVLIGPEKITIRHRIPARRSSPGGRQRQPDADTEGDHRPGYLLRWERASTSTRSRSASWRTGRNHRPGCRTPERPGTAARPATRGAGLSRAAARIRRIVPSPTRCPSPMSSPWSRR